MAEIIDDPASFTRAILGNQFITEAQVQDVVDVMDDQLRSRVQAANADNRVGTDRDQYFFFQGCVAGMLIAFKQTKRHYEDTAWQHGVDPNTGDKIDGHGNA